MAREDRKSASDIKSELLDKGSSFSFFQGVRLLKRLNEKSVKIRPNLSLSFQKSAIEYIEEDEQNFIITTNLFGLYGTGSPLPTFYTEELIEEERAEESFSRDFINIINERIYELLFAAWVKYKNMLQTLEEKNDKHIERLYSFIGLGTKELRDNIKDSYSLIRYSGLLNQFPKSVSGLETLLSDAFSDTKITIVSCIRRRARLSEDQRCLLGMQSNILGENTYICTEMTKRDKFRIRLGPFTEQEFRRFFPGTEDYMKLIFLTNIYISEPLEFDIECVIKEKQIETPRLGEEKWSCLGLDTWTFSGESFSETSSIFNPNYFV